MRYVILIIISVINAALLRPNNLDTLHTIYGLFEWEQTPNAKEYNLQISTDNLFESIILDTTISKLMYLETQNLNWNNNYYWRVKPILNNNSVSEWINEFFVVISNPIFNNNGLIHIDYEINNLHLIQDGLNIFGDWRREQTIVFDEQGYEVYNTKFGTINFSEFGNWYGRNYNSRLYSKFNFQKDILWESPSLPDLDPHDFNQAPNGNYFFFLKETQLGPIPLGDWTQQFQALGYEADGETIEFPWLGYKIVEIDSDTKEEIWSWNAFDYFSLNYFDSIGETWWWAIQGGFYDWLHVNSFDFDQQMNYIYISNRHLSRITKINYITSKIIWNIGLSDNYNTGDNNICNDLNFSWQHHVRVLDNGNLLFFDNGNLSEILRGTDYPTSRVLEIEIIDDNYCNIIWEYDLSENFYGNSWGSVQKLDNGNYLVNSRSNDIGNIIEITKDKNIIWNATLNHTNFEPVGANYRAFRLPSLYPDAYYVVFDSLSTLNLDTIQFSGIFLSEDNDFKVEAFNESGYTQDYYYKFSIDNNFISTNEGIITIEAYNSIKLNFENIDLENLISNINFIIYPVHHEYAKKEFNFTVFVNELNNNIEEFNLFDIYPNPSNSNINIIYDVPYSSEVNILVYNLNGRLIEQFSNAILEKGRYYATWNASNHSSGTYVVKMISNDFIKTKKITLIK